MEREKREREETNFHFVQDNKIIQAQNSQIVGWRLLKTYYIQSLPLRMHSMSGVQQSGI